jgi:hypothetical protein
MRPLRHLVALVAAFVVSGSAQAQPPEEEQPEEYPGQALPPPPPTGPVVQEREVIIVQQPMVRHRRPRRCWESHAFSPCEIALTVGGGGAGFLTEGARAMFHTGAAWDTRIIVGTRSVIAFELGYAGTLNRFRAPGAQPSLLAQSIDSTFRINLLPWRIEPFIFGGIGYNHTDIIDADDNPRMASVLARKDDTLLVPAGGGLAVYMGRHATVDARFTYRAMFYQKLFLLNPDERTDQWSVLGRLGYGF